LMVAAAGARAAIIGSTEQGGAPVSGRLLSSRSALGVTPLNLAECGVDAAAASLQAEGGALSLSFTLPYTDTNASRSTTCGGAASPLALERGGSAVGLILAHGGGAVECGHSWRIAATALGSDGSSADSDERRRGATLVGHAILMGTAWLAVAPVAALIARHGRLLLPRRWLTAHIALQSLGALLTFLGFAMAVMMNSETGYQHFDSTHAQLGLLIVALVLFQLFMGACRPAEASSQRGAWEFLHKGLGALLLFLGYIGVLLGSAETAEGAALLLPLFVFEVLSAIGLGFLEVRHRRRVKQLARAELANAGGDSDGAAEQSSIWITRVDAATGRPYYVNTVTRASQWQVPDALSSPTTPTNGGNGGSFTTPVSSKRAVADRDRVDLELSGERSQPPPPPSNADSLAAWVQHTDPGSGCKYWYNTRTGVSTWQRPTLNPTASFPASSKSRKEKNSA